jgi:hypothetical protein
MDVWQYGTPAIGYSMGVQSKEIDMNLRMGDSPTPPVTVRKLLANFGDKNVSYMEKQ